jgi:Na+-driven multidrug efflux pump
MSYKRAKDSLADMPSETFGERAKLILNLAIPGAMFSVVNKFMEFVNIIYSGKLNDTAKLAGVGMGNMLINLFGVSLMVGCNFALDTFVSQAAGAGNKELCGIYVHRARFITVCLLIPVCLLLMNAEAILIACGQDPEVSAYS